MKAEIRHAETPTEGQARKAIFWSIPDVKERTFDSSGISAEGTLVFASEEGGGRDWGSFLRLFSAETWSRSAILDRTCTT